MLNVKIKKLHPNAVIPTYAKPGDAGLDLTSISWEISHVMSQITYKTGLSIEIPEGYVGLIFPRSSIYKTSLVLSNSVGVIDSGYRGEIGAVFNLDRIDKVGYSTYSRGDRIMQLVIIPYPKIQFEEVTELSESERGTGGYGSTGV